MNNNNPNNSSKLEYEIDLLNYLFKNLSLKEDNQKTEDKKQLISEEEIKDSKEDENSSVCSEFDTDCSEIDDTDEIDDKPILENKCEKTDL